jgi:hypothetical protein
MSPDASFDKGLLRMAGIAGVLGGLLILLFAIVADSNGVFFYNAVFTGASVDPWMQNVLASPRLSRAIMALPALGFSCMFVVIGVLYRYIRPDSWQKTLAVIGYAIGVPVAVVTFMLQLSLMNQVLLVHANRPELAASLDLIAGLQLHFFHVVNHFVGPFFIIVVGTMMMAWAGLRSGDLPRWICGWLILCGAMVFISFLAPLVPVLSVLGIFARAVAYAGFCCARGDSAAEERRLSSGNEHRHRSVGAASLPPAVSSSSCSK